MAGKSVPVAIVGAGGRGRAHARGLAYLARKRGRAVEVAWVVDPDQPARARVSGETGAAAAAAAPAVCGELAHFLDAIGSGARPQTDGYEALRSLRLIWRLYAQEDLVGDLA